MAEASINYSGPRVSWEDAVAAGSVYFFTGEKCIRGHIDRRYTNGRLCRACKKERHERYEKKSGCRAKDLGRERQRRFAERFGLSLTAAIENAVKVAPAISGSLTSKTSKLRRYGISPEVFAQMFVEQGGKCKICGADGIAHGDRRTALVIDHCHITGAIRGLLCKHCNLGLGSFSDNPESLIAAAAYLESRPVLFADTFRSTKYTENLKAKRSAAREIIAQRCRTNEINETN